MPQGSRYIILASPRAATAYISSLLTNIGLNCSHESFFKFEQRWQGFLKAGEIFGEASWLAVPFLERMPLRVPILHQTRHPVDVIRSLLQIRFVDLDDNDLPVRQGVGLRFTQFAYRHCPMLFEYATTRERAIWFYYFWNRKIEEGSANRQILRYAVEHLSPDCLRQILDHIGVPQERVPDDVLTANFELLPRNINTKSREKIALTEDVTWDDLPEAVQQLASSYGYAPAISTGEIDPASPDAVQQAQQALRKQAQTLLRHHAEERSKLVTNINYMRARLHEAEQARQATSQESTTTGLAGDDDGRAIFPVEDQQVSQRYPDGIETCEGKLARRARAHWVCSKVVGQRVLGVGCSQSTTAIILGREGANVVGIDIRETAIREAQDALQREPQYVRDNVEFALVDVFDTTFQPGSFDTIILDHILDKLTQPARLLDLVCRWLRHGGQLIATAPHGFRPHCGQKSGFYLSSYLGLLGQFLTVVEVDLVDGLYLCAITVKPDIGQMPQPPQTRKLESWTRACNEALYSSQARDYWKHNLEKVSLQEDIQAIRHTLEESRRTGARLLQNDTHLQTKISILHEQLCQARAAQVRLTGSHVLADYAPSRESAPLTGRPSQTKGGILFFAVNGAGLGHLTRSLAVAKRIRQVDPSMPIYFLTSSQALPLIARHGIIAYHIPPFSAFGHGIRTDHWNDLLLKQIQMIVALHHPAALVYDGVFPYGGLMKALSRIHFACTAMILRLRHRHDRLIKVLPSLKRFNHVLCAGEPGLVMPREFGALNHKVFDPIMLLDKNEVLTREESLRKLGVPLDCRSIYVQLGAGNINSTKPWLDKILSVLSRVLCAHVVLGESPISDAEIDVQGNVHVLQHYPNAIYFNGFDLAICAAGYNTFHELMHHGVPSILVPNQKAVTDDQVARAKIAAEHGAAEVVMTVDKVEETIVRCLESDSLQAMRDRARSLVPRNGAGDVAEYLLEAVASEAAGPVDLARLESV
ncbi:MAG: methyltransferase domain-containing protein [Planctomycetota bacterium]